MYDVCVCVDKPGTSFGSAKPQDQEQEPYPLPCLNLITLITYLFSLLLFVCLSCPWASPYLRTLADTTLLHARVLAINKLLYNYIDPIMYGRFKMEYR
jgi:hypothetical protein